MCYNSKARVPFPPASGGTARGEELTLTAGDGTRFAAFAARPERPAPAQVIILPDVRGLHQFYKDLALHFAEAGVAALAIDYFGRTAGRTARDDNFEFMPHVQQLRIQGISADPAAAANAARTDLGGAVPTFTVGFCMGGSISLLAGTGGYDFAGVIGFYAGLRRAIGGNPTVLDAAVTIVCPVLGLFGGADQGIPAADVAALDTALDRADVAHEIHTYPGAPHSFFDRRWEEHAEASSDAWQRMLAFIRAHTPA